MPTVRLYTTAEIALNVVIYRYSRIGPTSIWTGCPPCIPTRYGEPVVLAEQSLRSMQYNLGKSQLSGPLSKYAIAKIVCKPFV